MRNLTIKLTQLPFQLGKVLVDKYLYLQHLFAIPFLVLDSVINSRNQRKEKILEVVLSQVYFTAIQAFPIVIVLALAVGTVLNLQAFSSITLIGGKNAVAPFLISAIVKEAGPLLISLIVIARSGTAVATELGNMKINREIEALESLGINPVSYIILPRLLGGIVSVVSLSVLFNVTALLGGFLIANLSLQQSFSFYLDSLLTSLSSEDVIVFLIKNSLAGFFIFVISCAEGLSANFAPHEVPRATTRAVVNSVILVVGSHLMITVFYSINKIKGIGAIF